MSYKGLEAVTYRLHLLGVFVRQGESKKQNKTKKPTKTQTRLYTHNKWVPNRKAQGTSRGKMQATH